VCYEILDIGLDLVESYSPEITNRIDYFGCFCPEQVLVEENINIHRHKEEIKLASVFIVKVRGLNYSILFLHNDSLYCR
jgi:hypothetical protein